MLSESDFPPLPSQAQQKTKTSPKRTDGNDSSREMMKRQQPATTLNDLPVELLLGILEYLPGWTVYDTYLYYRAGTIGRHTHELLTLVNLSLTSRRLHHIVSDRLYADFNSRFHNPYPFLRTMASNPSLASHVKSVSFRYGSERDISYDVQEGRPAYVPSVHDKQLIKDGFKKLGLPNWKAWASDCNEASTEQEVIFAAILMYTPNVEHLDICEGELSYRFAYWLRNLRHAVNGVGEFHRFEHLRSIDVNVEYLKLRHLAPIFKLQSMRTVILRRLVEWALTKEDEPEALRRYYRPRTSMVEDLQLKRSFVEDGLLDVLLSCIVNLKAFRYDICEDGFAINGDASFEYWEVDIKPECVYYDVEDAKNCYGKVIESLSNHSKSLESLIWFTRYERWYEGCEERDMPSFTGPAGDLSRFSSLTDIEIPVSMLVMGQEKVKVSTLAERLPASVQGLTLFHCGEGERSQVQFLVRNYPQYVPSLRELRVTHRDGTDGFGQSDYQELQKICWDNDIGGFY